LELLINLQECKVPVGQRFHSGGNFVG